MNLFDASALLSFLQDEDGSDVVQREQAVGGACSAANWSETALRLHARNSDWSLARALLLSYRCAWSRCALRTLPRCRAVAKGAGAVAGRSAVPGDSRAPRRDGFGRPTRRGAARRRSGRSAELPCTSSWRGPDSSRQMQGDERWLGCFYC